MDHGTTATFKIYGATVSDGSAVTYSIPPELVMNGLTFSKTSGIAENENVTITAPTIEGYDDQLGVLSIRAESVEHGHVAHKTHHVTVKADEKPIVVVTVSPPTKVGNVQQNGNIWPENGIIGVYAKELAEAYLANGENIRIACDGAQASDGSPVTYELWTSDPKVTFSKTSGIQPNELITIKYAPTVTITSQPAYPVILYIRAKSSGGVYSNTVTRNMQVHWDVHSHRCFGTWQLNPQTWDISTTHYVYLSAVDWVTSTKKYLAKAGTTWNFKGVGNLAQTIRIESSDGTLITDGEFTGEYSSDGTHVHIIGYYYGI